MFGKFADLIQEIVKLIPGLQGLFLGGSKYFAAFDKISPTLTAGRRVFGSKSS